MKKCNFIAFPNTLKMKRVKQPSAIGRPATQSQLCVMNFVLWNYMEVLVLD